MAEILALVAEHSMDPVMTGTIAGSGLGGALVWALFSLVKKAERLVEAMTRHIEAQDSHRKDEREHWRREEEMLRAAIPQHVTGPHTPVQGIPVG